MMGLKKLGELKRELRQVLGKAPNNLGAWLDRQAVRLERNCTHDPRVMEDLVWVRKMLRAAVKKPGAAKTRKSREANKLPLV
jgi:hypothetical protein